jgi:hypothetical protein
MPSHAIRIMDSMLRDWLGSSIHALRHRAVAAPRVYVSARFSRQDELRAIAEEMQRAGLEVTSRWLHGSEPLRECDLGEHGRGAEIALNDFADLRAADICFAFTDGDGRFGRGGRHTELGIALALGLRTVIVGPREQVFHCLPGVEHFPSWEAAREALIGHQSEAGSPPPSVCVGETEVAVLR